VKNELSAYLLPFGAEYFVFVFIHLFIHLFIYLFIYSFI